MRIESVVADANVLLSAVVGKAALRVFTDFEIAVHVSEFNAGEVREYLPHMAAKYGLSLEMAEMQWKLLPMKVHPISGYEKLLERACADLAARDPEDAHALALARRLRLPLWTNDRDFEGLDVTCYSTARLLAVLRSEPL